MSLQLGKAALHHGASRQSCDAPLQLPTEEGFFAFALRRGGGSIRLVLDLYFQHHGSDVYDELQPPGIVAAGS